MVPHSFVQYGPVQVHGFKHNDRTNTALLAAARIISSERQPEHTAAVLCRLSAAWTM